MVRHLCPWLAAALGALVLVACSEADAPPPPIAGDRSPGSPPGDFAVLEEWGEDVLAPGRYGMTANGLPGVPWAVVEVPASGEYSGFEGWTVFDASDGSALGYWTVSGVDRDPCEAASPLLEVGTGVGELVEALDRQRRTRVSEPEPATLAGHDGVTVTVSMPPGTVPAECPDDGYELWVSEPGGGRYFADPEQYDQLWILDVDGQVVVVQAGLRGDRTEENGAGVRDLIRTLEFVARD